VHRKFPQSPAGLSAHADRACIGTSSAASSPLPPGGRAPFGGRRVGHDVQTSEPDRQTTFPDTVLACPANLYNGGQILQFRYFEIVTLGDPTQRGLGLIKHAARID